MTLKILVADDSKLIRNMYKDQFQKNGHAVISSANGVDCLKLYSQYEIDSDNTGILDAVILDYNLPDMKGSEIAKKIIEKNPLQQIIVISDSNTAALKEAFKEVRNNVEILQKGFPVDALVTKLEKQEEK